VEIWVSFSELIYDMERLDLDLSAARALIAAGTPPGDEAIADIERHMRECHAAVRTRLGMLGLSTVSET